MAAGRRGSRGHDARRWSPTGGPLRWSGGRPGSGRGRACGPSAPAGGRRASRRAASPLDRGTRSRTRCSSSTGTGPSTSAPSGRSTRWRTSSSAPRSPVTVASRAAGGRWACERSCGLPTGEAGRVPPHERLQRGVGRVADGDDVAAGSHEGCCVEPPAQRLLGRPQVVAGQAQPGVEDDDGGVALVGDGLGPDGGDHEVGRRRRPGRRRARRWSCGRWCRGTSGPAPPRCGPRPAPARAARGRRTWGTPRPPRRGRTTGSAAAPPDRPPRAVRCRRCSGRGRGRCRRPATRRSRHAASARAPARW